MTDEIRITEIPPALHHLQWSDFPEEQMHDPTVRVVRDAHAVAEGAWVATLAGHRTVMQDVTHTEASNLRRSHEAANRRLKEAEAATSRALRAAAADLEDMDKAMRRVPEIPSPHVVQMIADRMSRMDDKARHQLMADALANDDHWTLASALFHGPAWVYGLSASKRELLIAEYQHRKFPELVARREAITKAADLLVKGIEAHRKAVAKLVDGKQVEKAQALAEAAQKALA